MVFRRNNPPPAQIAVINEEAIFEAAAAQPVAERRAYLDAVCAMEPEVRARVEVLLRSHDATGFMEAASRPARRVFVLVLGTIAENIRMTTPIHEIPGDTDSVGRIGPE